jgi:RimJ/RimL family protein N-acetyltransferase
VHEPLEAVLRQARRLRLDGRIEESYQTVCAVAGPDLRVGSLPWQHHPRLWSDISARSCILSRRGPADLPFLRKLWSNKTFVRQFHRLAPELPASDQRLTEILRQEFAALLQDNRALHFVVRDRKGGAQGLLSLVDLSLQHRKAEVLLGVLPNAPFGLATAAMLMLFQFYFKALRFHKLYSLVYPDNPHSLAGTLHLGFRIEGRLKEEVYDASTGGHGDLIRTGLPAEDAFTPGNRRLMERLLRATSGAGPAR